MNWFDTVLKSNGNLPLIIMSLVAAAIGGLLLSFVALQESERKRRRTLRINRSAQKEMRTSARRLSKAKATPDVRLQLATSRIGLVDVMIRRVLPDVARFRTRLRRTGRAIPIDRYLLVCFILGLIVAYVLFATLGLSYLLAGLGGLVVGILLPHFIVGYMGRKRQQKMLDQFPDAIDMIVRAVRSGLPVSESIKVIADQVRPPIGYEFQQIADSMKLGSTLNEALAAASEQIELQEFRFFIIALAVQQDTGGNLGEMLENLSKMLRRRRQMKMKIRAITAEARASAWLLGCMPFVMFGIISMLNRGYANELISDPRGIAMVLTGFTMTCIGIAVMVKMAKFPF